MKSHLAVRNKQIICRGSSESGKQMDTLVFCSLFSMHSWVGGRESSKLMGKDKQRLYLRGVTFEQPPLPCACSHAPQPHPRPSVWWYHMPLLASLQLTKFQVLSKVQVTRVLLDMHFCRTAGFLCLPSHTTVSRESRGNSRSGSLTLTITLVLKFLFYKLSDIGDFCSKSIKKHAVLGWEFYA